MNINRRHYLCNLAAMPFFSWSLSAIAQPGSIESLPKEIQLIAAVSPGGGPDTAARAVAAFAEKTYGMSVTVQNQPQVQGESALAQFLKVSDQGKTWLIAPNSLFTINPHIYPRQHPDPLHGLQTVAQAGANFFVLLVKADDPIQQLSDFVREAKASDKPLNYGSGGSGSSHHMLMVDLADRLNIKLNHVAYDGGSKAAAGLARGDVRLAFGAAGALPLVKAGRLRILAVASPQRLPQFPDVPSLSEIVPGFNGDAWYGWFGQRQTPASQITAFATLLRNAMNDPEVQNILMTRGGISPTFVPGQVLAERIVKDFKHYKRLVDLIPR